MQARLSGFEDSIADVTFDTSRTRPPLTLNSVQSVYLLNHFSFPLHSSCGRGKSKQYAELSFTSSTTLGHAESHFIIQSESSLEYSGLPVQLLTVL